MDKNKNRKLRVLVSGGGTGGHIFPALAIANALRRRNPEAEILFVGAEGRMEMERVPAAGYDVVGLPVAGFDRKRLWRNFGVLVKLWRSMRRARKVLADFKPDVAVGVGGYASGPMLKAAQRRGIPTLIQEQNSYAGVTNKLLAAKASAICTAYPDMERFFPADRIVLTGNPVRAELLKCTLTQEQAKESLGFDGRKPLVFITGGSLGARSLNDAVAASLQRIVDAGVQVMWQTGKLYIDRFAPVADGLEGVKAMPFVADMATAYRAADLVVARAGAGTISELQLLGKASVLVPSPNVAEDHQTKNAMALSTHDAAVMIPDRDVSARLADEVTGLLADGEMRRSLERNVAAMAMTDSDERIVDQLLKLVSD